MVFEPGQELEDFGNLFDFAMANALALVIYHRRHSMPYAKGIQHTCTRALVQKAHCFPSPAICCYVYIAAGEVALPADAKHPWRAAGGRKLLQQALGTAGSESEYLEVNQNIAGGRFQRACKQ